MRALIVDLIAFVCLMSLLAWALGAEAQPAEDPLAGIYSVQGMDGQMPYTGAATIRQFGDGYIVHSVVSVVDEDGAPKSVTATRGVGVRKGDQLSIGWKDAELIGVTVYVIKDGKLTGAWLTLPGGGQVRTETLIRIAPLPKVKPMSSTSAVVAPDRPDPSPAKEKPVPKLAAECQFGAITQHQRVLSIAGSSWSAGGEIRKDGKIVLQWVRGSDGVVCVGVYELKDRNLVGAYAYCGMGGGIDEAGELFGQTIPEVLYLKDAQPDQ